MLTYYFLISILQFIRMNFTNELFFYIAITLLIIFSMLLGILIYLIISKLYDLY